MRCQSCNYAELGSKVGSAPNKLCGSSANRTRMQTLRLVLELNRRLTDKATG
jgi:hypothetical protein